MLSLLFYNIYNDELFKIKYWENSKRDMGVLAIINDG